MSAKPVCVQYIHVRMYEVSCIYSHTYMYVCSTMYCTVLLLICTCVCLSVGSTAGHTHQYPVPLALLACVVQENIKSLIGYISEKHLSGLEGVHYVCTFQALKMKHLEELDHQGATGGASSDTS